METVDNTRIETFLEERPEIIERSPLCFADKNTQAVFDDATFIENCIKEGVVHTLTVGAKLGSCTLECDGGLFFDGEIHGNMRINGSLVVGKNGVIVGDIVAQNIYNFGTVNAGTIECPGSLINRGLLRGNIVVPENETTNKQSPLRTIFGEGKR